MRKIKVSHSQMLPEDRLIWRNQLNGRNTINIISTYAHHKIPSWNKSPLKVQHPEAM